MDREERRSGGHCREDFMTVVRLALDDVEVEAGGHL